MKLYVLLLSVLLIPACKPPVPPPPPVPQIVMTRLENDVFQFQYDNGQGFNTGEFMNFLDGWLQKHPEITIKSIVPQEVLTDSKRSTHGVLVFTKIDPSKVPAPKEEKK